MIHEYLILTLGVDSKWQLRRILSFDGNRIGTNINCNVDKKFRLARTFFFDIYPLISLWVNNYHVLCIPRPFAYIWRSSIWFLVTDFQLYCSIILFNYIFKYSTKLLEKIPFLHQIIYKLGVVCQYGLQQQCIHLKGSVLFYL